MRSDSSSSSSTVTSGLSRMLSSDDSCAYPPKRQNMVVAVVCGYKGGAGEGSGEALESCCSCVGHMRRFTAATNAS